MPMPVLVSLADIRDIFIIVYGVLGIIFFFIATVATVLLFLSIRGLLKGAKDLLNDSIKPTVNSVREAAETVKGTTEYVGRTAVSPIMRTYGTVAGVKKGLGVLTGLNRRRRA